METRLALTRTGTHGPVVETRLLCCGLFPLCWGLFPLCCGLFPLCCGLFPLCCGLFPLCCSLFPFLPKALCVCQLRICSVSLSTVICQRKIGNKKEREKEKTRKQTYQRHIRAKVDHVTDCLFLPAHAISRAGYTQFVRCSEGADCPHYEWHPLRMLRSRVGKLSLRREFSPASSQHLPRCC